jgi:tetratricopeptide (TPR) repeat protein
LIVYGAQNFFVFDTISTLWLFFALLAALCVGSEKKAAITRPPPYIPVITACAIVLLVIPVAGKPLYANLLLGSGYVYHVADVNRSTAALKKGLDLATYADLEYGYQLYEMYSERQATQLAGAERMKAYQFARDTLERTFSKYPYDARTVVYLAHVLDLAPDEARDEGRIREVAAHAIELSPKRIQPWYIRANLVIRAGDRVPEKDPQREIFYREGIRILEEYGARVPSFAEPRFVIATLHLTLGDRVEAARWAEEGLVRYSRVDENTARRAARYYVLTEEWELARRFLEDVANSSDPTDMNALYDLAKAEFILGNVEKAATHVSRIRAEAPGLYETDAAFVQAFDAAIQE